jgi:hypothetical protein
MWRFGLGASVFFTLAVGPAFFSEEMLRLLGRPHAGAAAQLVLERYFIMHQICAGVALLHLVGEGVYLGRMIHRWTLGLLLVLLGFSLVAGYVIQPQLRSLHLTMYRPGLAVEEQETAGRSFRILHGVSQLINLAMVGGCVGLRGALDEGAGGGAALPFPVAAEGCRGGKKGG